MNIWMVRIRVWRLRRQQRSVEGWSRVRAKGKSRFVIQSALYFSLLMLVATALGDYYDDSGIQFPTFLYKQIYFVLGGVLLGFVSWWKMEGRYRNAKLEARIKAGMQQ
jgi:hypothetical protein